jgi:hypothetical protein
MFSSGEQQRLAIWIRRELVEERPYFETVDICYLGTVRAVWRGGGEEMGCSTLYYRKR